MTHWLFALDQVEHGEECLAGWKAGRIGENGKDNFGSRHLPGTATGGDACDPTLLSWFSGETGIAADKAAAASAFFPCRLHDRQIKDDQQQGKLDHAADASGVQVLLPGRQVLGIPVKRLHVVLDGRPCDEGAAYDDQGGEQPLHSEPEKAKKAPFCPDAINQASQKDSADTPIDENIVGDQHGPGKAAHGSGVTCFNERLEDIETG